MGGSPVQKPGAGEALQRLLGVDDATLIGAPSEMVAGSLEALRQPEAVIVDERGYRKMWPQGPIETGRTFEMNDRRAVVVGVCRASQTFQGFPVIYTRYSRALQFIPPRRKVLSFILAGNHPDYSLDEAAGSVIERTGLLAVTRDQFFWMTIRYYLGETGIPINFGITVLLGFLVGTAVAGQTFYLFTVENLDQYATLKAMGATNSLIASIVLQQALLVGFVGYGTGAGLAALFGVFARATDRLEFFMPWHVLVGTGVAVLFIVLLTAMLSLRRLFRLDPAEVFRI